MTLGKAHGEKPECARPAVRAAVVKAESVTQISADEKRYASDWTEPELPLEELGEMVRNSNILPQCIRAYKNNIAGYGIGIKYIEDDQEETEESKEEWGRLQNIVNLLSIEQDTKQVFEDIIEAREKYGIAYCEAIRDLEGNVVQLDFIKDTPSVRKTKPLLPYQDMEYFYHGRAVRRKKKFRKYKQEIGGSVVYFKEFGDPRVMDLRDGAYKDGIERQYQANEIIDFPVGVENYGEVRWIGQILGSDGSCRAEHLNNNYFVNGRHVPLLIAIKGGTLTEESYAKLQEYMDGIRGAAGQHSFLILETESIESNFDVKQPEIELKDLAGVLQKDELFQEYIENNRKRVQSAFNLPDLYVGYTKDFNRATAQTAMEVTEKQVFQPERASLAWAVNHRLLNGYRLKYCEVEFKAPEITNPDDLYKILTVAEKAGGLPPNKAKQVAYQALGESSDDYPGEWGEVPIAMSAQSAGQAAGQGTPPMAAKEAAGGNQEEWQQAGRQLDGQIEKAEQSGEPGEVLAVMKEVRRLLHDIKKQGDCDGKSYLKS